MKSHKCIISKQENLDNETVQKFKHINPENVHEIEDFSVHMNRTHLIPGKADQDWTTLGLS